MVYIDFHAFFFANLLTNKWDFDGAVSKSIKPSHKIVSFKCLSKFHNQQKWTTKNGASTIPVVGGGGKTKWFGRCKVYESYAAGYKLENHFSANEDPPIACSAIANKKLL
ncbi:uncharacterized protein LOC108089689 [Drosophila ficusphila]|uniref:uncharacterized protein LOC108089689 n=1 Tax=Drosophila ficusphila TaxID=30025 RepID=UPI0007E6EFFD|nr:uncharacterized protein LOC108089689 [Drosophila ficusphila]